MMLVNCSSSTLTVEVHPCHRVIKQVLSGCIHYLRSISARRDICNSVTLRPGSIADCFGGLRDNSEPSVVYVRGTHTHSDSCLRTRWMLHTRRSRIFHHCILSIYFASCWFVASKGSLLHIRSLMTTDGTSLYFDLCRDDRLCGDGMTERQTWQNDLCRSIREIKRSGPARTIR